MGVLGQPRWRGIRLTGWVWRVVSILTRELAPEGADLGLGGGGGARGGRGSTLDGVIPMVGATLPVIIRGPRKEIDSAMEGVGVRVDGGVDLEEEAEWGGGGGGSGGVRVAGGGQLGAGGKIYGVEPRGGTPDLRGEVVPEEDRGAIWWLAKAEEPLGVGEVGEMGGSVMGGGAERRRRPQGLAMRREIVLSVYEDRVCDTSWLEKWSFLTDIRQEWEIPRTHRRSRCRSPSGHLGPDSSIGPPSTCQVNIGILWLSAHLYETMNRLAEKRGPGSVIPRFFERWMTV